MDLGVLHQLHLNQLLKTHLVLRSSHIRAISSLPLLACHGGRKCKRCTGHTCGSEPYGGDVSRHIWNIWLLVLACQLLSRFYRRLPLILPTALLLFNFSPPPHPHVLPLLERLPHTCMYRYKMKRWHHRERGIYVSLVHLPLSCCFGFFPFFVLSASCINLSNTPHHTLLRCYSSTQHPSVE